MIAAGKRPVQPAEETASETPAVPNVFMPDNTENRGNEGEERRLLNRKSVV